MWGETRRDAQPTIYKIDFNPLSPCGERLNSLSIILHLLSISTHSPRVGRDTMCQTSEWRYNNFNPLSPCGERLDLTRIGGDWYDFNPLSPCGERPRCAAGRFPLHHFNPLSPCGERPKTTVHQILQDLFQPTLPVWGETYTIIFIVYWSNISTHSPRVGRDRMAHQIKTQLGNFNPLSPCGERHHWQRASRHMFPFQPTLPVWGETPE